MRLCRRRQHRLALPTSKRRQGRQTARHRTRRRLGLHPRPSAAQPRRHEHRRRNLRRKRASRHHLTPSPTQRLHDI